MPKLAAKDRKKVEKADAVSGDFQPLTPGKYIATLSQVEAKNSAAGNPVWNAEFTDVMTLEGEKQPGRQWYNLNLPTSDEAPEGYTKGAEKWATYQRMCAGRLKAFFEAFGYTVDSDTDEMIGDKVVLQIGITTIQKGPRAGQKTNSVNAVLPLGEIDTSDFESSDGEDGEF